MKATRNVTTGYVAAYACVLARTPQQAERGTEGMRCWLRTMPRKGKVALRPASAPRLLDFLATPARESFSQADNGSRQCVQAWRRARCGLWHVLWTREHKALQEIKAVPRRQTSSNFGNGKCIGGEDKDIVGIHFAGHPTRVHLTIPNYLPT